MIRAGSDGMDIYNEWRRIDGQKRYSIGPSNGGTTKKKETRGEKRGKRKYDE